MTTQEFIFNTPLYREIKEDAPQIISDLQHSWSPTYVDPNYLYEGYNSQRHVESTYHVCDGLVDRDSLRYLSSIGHNVFEKNQVMYVTLECGRYRDKLDIIVFVNADKRSIMKIGQYPSVADIHMWQIKKYNKILPKADMTDLTRAIGLAANGVGIGSLRRIFENLITEAQTKAMQDKVVIKEDFDKKRISDKIHELSDYLPKTIVEFKDIYSILSKGIHELSEKECLEYFDVMIGSIKLILDEKLSQFNSQMNRKNMKQAVSQIKYQLSTDEKK